MGKIAVYFSEEKLPQVLAFLRSGVMANIHIDPELGNEILEWCDEQEEDLSRAEKRPLIDRIKTSVHVSYKGTCPQCSGMVILSLAETDTLDEDGKLNPKTKIEIDCPLCAKHFTKKVSDLTKLDR